MGAVSLCILPVVRKKSIRVLGKALEGLEPLVNYKVACSCPSRLAKLLLAENLFLRKQLALFKGTKS